MRYLIWLIYPSGYQQRWGPGHPSREIAEAKVRKQWPNLKYWIEECKE